MFIVQPKGWWGGGQRYWSRESLHIFLFKSFQFFSVVYLGNIYARFFPPGNIQMWIFTQDIARHAPFLINPPEYRKILAMLLSPSINRYMCFIPKITRINSSSKTWAIGHIEGQYLNFCEKMTLSLLPSHCFTFVCKIQRKNIFCIKTEVPWKKILVHTTRVFGETINNRLSSYKATKITTPGKVFSVGEKHFFKMQLKRCQPE